MVKSYVIDRNGNRRSVSPDYVLQDGEVLHYDLPLMLKDSAPTGTFLRDNSRSYSLGEVVATDSVAGMERIRFADDTSALRNPDGTWLYCGINGQAGLPLTQDQDAHRQLNRGAKLGDVEAERIKLEARRDAAHDHMVDHLTVAGRSGNRQTQDAAGAHSAMVSDLSNAWRG